MKQLSFLNLSSNNNLEQDKNYWKIFVDGAARNNPGPAGAGIYIIKNNQDFIKSGYYLGTKTNNQAEYYAFLISLFLIKSYIKPCDNLEITSDSELLVRQLNAIYKVKDEELKTLHKKVISILKPYCYTIKHVLRQDNHVADALANTGIDKKIALPEEFFTWASSL